MADFSSVPVVDVHSKNIGKMWPMLISAVRSSTFIALDIEMSGLGDRKKLFVKDMDERYKNMCDAAKTRSIIAMGLSCFKYVPLKETQDTTFVKYNYLAQTFNLMLLSSEPYTVDPVSLKFLLDHGFDFNMQYSKGLPYASSPSNNKTDDSTPSVQSLVEELIRNKIPVVLHNGLMDLVFIYQCFHCPLPASMSTFTTDLSLMFSGGLYDTKFLAEFEARVAASYLEYVFRKCQRTNMERHQNGEKCITMSFLSYPMSPDLSFLPCGLHYAINSDTPICDNYANHGWCKAASECTLSHDVDLIIDKESTVIQKKRRKRQRKRNRGANKEMAVEEMNPQENELTNEDDSAMDCSDNALMKSVPENSNTDMEGDPDTCGIQDDAEDKQNVDAHSTAESDGPPLIKEGRTGGHRAGFDAFMTGFAFAAYVACFSEVNSIPENANLSDFEIAKLANKLSISGKDNPLPVVQSSFSKPSKAHKQKMEKLMSTVK